MILRAKGIKKSYGERAVIDSIDFEVQTGEWVTILGPNGSGKSTLLECITGATKLDQGEVMIKEKTLSSYTAQERAKIIAFLTQEALPALPNTVEEIVLMGRYPYQRFRWPWYQKQDIEVVEQVLQFTDTQPFRYRQVSELSGGERQRVAMAMALAQEPDILVLDEPTTFLDVYYQLSLFDLLKSWQRTKQATVIAVLHDINLASLYSDRLYLLKDGQLVDSGQAVDLITETKVAEVFAIDPIIIKHPKKGVPQVLLKGDNN
jgi:iron complex transport system ATP-binding protein